jgi:hypothetical protein
MFLICIKLKYFFKWGFFMFKIKSMQLGSFFLGSALLFIAQVGFAQVIVPGKVSVVELDPATAKLFAVLKVEGNIAPPLAEEFKAALLQFPTGRRVILDFQSPGGMNTEGYKIIETIKEAKKNLIIDTFVDNGALCASMCIPLFMQGRKRVAGARASFMFHGASPWYTNVPNVPETKEYTDVLIAAGASEKWIQKLWDEGVFSDPVEYWADGEDLYNEGSNIVTQLKPKLVKHEPWSAPIDPQIGSH